MKTTTIEILTAKDNSGRVKVKAAGAFGAHGYTSNWVKVQENKKGSFITFNKKRVYIQVPQKGVWIGLDFYGKETSNEKEICGFEWVGETFEIEIPGA